MPVREKRPVRMMNEARDPDPRSSRGSVSLQGIPTCRCRCSCGLVPYFDEWTPQRVATYYFADAMSKS